MFKKLIDRDDLKLFCAIIYSVVNNFVPEKEMVVYLDRVFDLSENNFRYQKSIARFKRVHYAKIPTILEKYEEPEFHRSAICTSQEIAEIEIPEIHRLLQEVENLKVYYFVVDLGNSLSEWIIVCEDLELTITGEPFVSREFRNLPVGPE
ncbi:hypothetical protein V6Z05_19500 [Leptospira venezuelensis]|uniref:hypothetical protein n=1 Tax=Leptospira venezuelensis TaxID=1958811 RepID=UPI000A3D507F|nr:hypothetical protein [Leptospira venezuelensis]